MKTKEVEKIIAEKLKIPNFIKEKYGFVKKCNENILGNIGFNVASYGTPGVRYVDM